MAEMLSRDVLWERREERLETLLCALLHTTPDIGTSATDISAGSSERTEARPKLWMKTTFSGFLGFFYVFRRITSLGSSPARHLSF
jgi:hypothetical protein